MELIIVNKEITNKSLAGSLARINKAITAGTKAGWAVAIELHKIINNKTFTDDFKEQREFAKFIGMSESQVSKIVRAVDMNDKLTGLGLSELSVGAVSEMLTIPINELGNFVDGFEITNSSTVREIRECVKCYNEDKLPNSKEEKSVVKETAKSEEKSVVKETAKPEEKSRIQKAPYKNVKALAQTIEKTGKAYEAKLYENGDLLTIFVKCDGVQKIKMIINQKNGDVLMPEE